MGSTRFCTPSTRTHVAQQAEDKGSMSASIYLWQSQRAGDIENHNKVQHLEALVTASYWDQDDSHNILSVYSVLEAVECWKYPKRQHSRRGEQ